MNLQEQEELLFQSQRVFAVAARSILVLLEDFREQHNNNFEKLRQNLPSNFAGVIDMADYLDANSYGYYRKKVLDVVNSSRRDLENFVSGK